MNSSHKILIALCLLTLAFYAYSFNSPIPYAEEQFHLLSLIQKFYSGTLSIADYLAPDYCDHWHLVSYALLLPPALLTHWNAAYPMILAICFAILTLAVLLAYLNKLQHHGNLSIQPLACVLAAYLLFSLDPFENWIMNWQLCFITATFGLIAGTAMLSIPQLTVRAVCLSVLGGLIATYSYSTALCFWPLGLTLLLFRPFSSLCSRLLSLLVWIVATGLVAWHFYYGLLATKSAAASFSMSFSKLIYLAIYVPTYFGAPISRFTQKGWVIAAFGSFGLLLFSFLAYRLMKRRFLGSPVVVFSISLVCLAAGSALLTGWGRMPLGLRQAATPRYITFGNYFWLGLVILLLLSERGLTRGIEAGGFISKRLRNLSLCTFVILKCANQIYFIPEARQYHDSFTGVYQDIATYYPRRPISGLGLERIGCGPYHCESFIAMLYRYRLNMFSDLPQ